MRNKDLNRLYWLNKDIERRQERIKELEAEAERVTTFLSTLPKSKGFKDRLSQIVANIIDEKMIILLKTEELSIECRKIEYFLNDVKMALLAKPCNSIIAIKQEKSEKFLSDSKKNAISKKNLEICLKYSEMIKHKGVDYNEK